METEGEMCGLPRYNCNDPTIEPPRKTVVSTPHFQVVEQFCLDTLHKFSAIVGTVEFSEELKLKLQKEIDKLQPQLQESNVRYCLVGDLGKGKSSLINSLLGCGTVANKGDAGSSCTWVVHHYRKQFQDQQYPFEVRVHYLEIERVRELMQKLLKRWYRTRQAKTATNDNAEDESNNDFNTDDDNESEGEDSSDSEKCVDFNDTIGILRTLFCDREQFSTKQNALDYLSEARSQDNNNVIDELTRWAEGLKSTNLKGSTYMTCHAATAQELPQAMSKYTSRDLEDMLDEDSKPQSWPLVDWVEVGLDAAIVNQGITLVDLPGITDKSQVRTDHAKRWRTECAGQILVADIARAADDGRLMSALQTGRRKYGPHNVIVALTRADSIDPKAKHRGTDEDVEKLDQLDYQERQYLKDISALRGKLHNQRNPEEIPAIQGQIKDITVALKAAKKQADTLRHRMRNRNIIHELRRNYQQAASETRHLSVFAVGNDDYSKHAEGFLLDYDPPKLDVEATQIPALRQALLTRPALRRYSIIMNLIQQRLPTMLRHFTLYCSSTRLDRKGNVYTVLSKARAAIQSSAKENLQKALRGVCETELLQKLRTYESEWMTKVRETCDSWVRKHSGPDFYKILKAHGWKPYCGKQNSKQPADWNGDLAELIAMLVGRCRDSFYNKVESSFSDCVRLAAAASERACKELKGDPATNFLLSAEFYAQLQCEPDELRGAMREAHKQFLDGAADAFSGLMEASEESFVAEAMEQIYIDVLTIRRVHGAHKLRRQELRRLLCKGRLWGIVLEITKNTFDQLVKEAVGLATKHLMKANNVVMTSFNFMCDSHASVDPTSQHLEVEFKEALQKAVIKTRDYLDGPLSEDVQLCIKDKP